MCTHIPYLSLPGTHTVLWQYTLVIKEEPALRAEASLHADCGITLGVGLAAGRGTL